MLISRNIELIDPEFLSPKLLRLLVLISRSKELIPVLERLVLRDKGTYSGAETRRPRRLKGTYSGAFARIPLRLVRRERLPLLGISI